MNSNFKQGLMACLISGSLSLGLSGCKEPVSTDVTNTAAAKAPAAMPIPAESSEPQHGHLAGNYGGIIVPIGADSYHAEVVVEKSGNFRLIMLGKDESRIQEVEVQPVKAFIKAEGESDATPIDLVAAPQEGDTQGKTSQFVGQIPAEAMGKTFAVVIPNLKIAGERFRMGFTTANVEHDSEMPSGASSHNESDLYLTPGGAYTEADIEVNGRVSASRKFKGIMSKHDMLPKEGDRICPITLTKANPKFTWVVGGKPYQFCCPPCVDEFIKLAKEHPEELKDPDTYIK